MHTMWKGSISFGLVHIPIKLYSATENKDIKLRMIHKECNSPIKYERTCPVCDKEVDNAEIVKGYEYEPGKFVLLEADDLEKIELEQNKSVEIIDFVKLEEIDPIYFNRSYFMGPNDNGQKAYMLLKQAMEKSGKIGVAKITIRSKQHLAIVRVYKNSLVLETIYFPDEVRNVDQVPGVPENVELSEKEMETAIQLIEQLTTQFEPEKYTDDYRTALMDLIQAKITGNEVKTSKETPQANVVDLMEALQASIDQTAPKKRKTTRKKKATG
ncbi:Ku protein [Anaerobacillus isosaccharinicus]|uniref:Non-homologous end joining protein Ku n=1 Tax=Anaerobacillus isosaccharinicus TaxID=1532552 RepID=A0A7S7L5G0_9BACI|nr:Ku protein [Anaerobacillus isosaccharinicus]MBA5586998.1 Ku protein [Anaerobacillus isosaccharinicus]QOY34801.1 Ku protein [Anaerobacillus isosaccharinicus]